MAEMRLGVVQDMLETPGVRKALGLVPVIKPVSCQMVFGYEVGDGKSDNAGYRGQRPDSNWRRAEAGGGIILDMCHQAYLSHALFGTTERLSAVARLLVLERVSGDGGRRIRCEVEAIYQSAARGGQPIAHGDFLHHPDKVPLDWKRERLEGVL